MTDWRWTRAEWRAEQAYNALVDAAERGLPCPTNEEIQDLTGFKTSAASQQLLRRLESDGRIRLNGERRSRSVTIIATGKTTGQRESCIPGIIASAAVIWGVRASDIYGPARFQRFVHPRMAACAVSVETGLAYAEVARFLGSDHTTIIHARRKAGILAQRDPDYREKLSMLRAHTSHALKQVTA